MSFPCFRIGAIDGKKSGKRRSVDRMLAARESKILSTRYAQGRRVETWPFVCGLRCGWQTEGEAYAIESSPWNDWESLDIMHYVWAYVTAPAARHASPPAPSSFVVYAARSAISQHERELATPTRDPRSQGWSSRKLPIVETSTSIFYALDASADVVDISLWYVVA